MLSAVRGGRVEDEASGRDGEGLGHKGCRGFLLVFYTYYDRHIIGTVCSLSFQ